MRCSAATTSSTRSRRWTRCFRRQLGFTDAQIGLLDTAYNVAALLTLIAGGVLIDRLGTRRFGRSVRGDRRRRRGSHRRSAGAPTGRACVGDDGGRFVLGVGSELFIVAVTTVVGRWFKGKEISFALAIQIVIARLGSWAADKSPDFARASSAPGSRPSSWPRASGDLARLRRHLRTLRRARGRYRSAPRRPPTSWCWPTSFAFTRPTGGWSGFALRSTRPSFRFAPSPTST